MLIMHTQCVHHQAHEIINHRVEILVPLLLSPPTLIIMALFLHIGGYQEGIGPIS
jgi:hypothetical protein